MHKYNKRYSRMITVLIAAAAAVMAMAPMPSYAVSKWTSVSWGTPNLGANARVKAALGNFNADPAHPNTLDLVIGDSNGVVHVYFNVGTATAPAWSVEQTGLQVITGGSNAVPALADLNGDGLLDLIVGGRNTVRIYQNHGTAITPNWIENTAWEISGLATNKFYAPSLANLNGDVDGNGKPKIDIMLGWSTGSVIGYKNVTTDVTAGPQWQRETTWDTFSVTSNSIPALADLNGDGLPDMLIGGLYGSIFAFYNTGTAAVPVWTTIGDWFVADPNPSANNYSGPTIGDLNGDGLKDLLVGDISGVQYGYRNDGLPKYPTSGTGPPPIPPTTTTEVDTFDSFNCSGNWTLAAGGPNNSYTRKCSDGWSAFAEDVNESSFSNPSPGPVGNTNVVTKDAVNGPNAPTSTLGTAEIYSNPDSAVGVLWLLKTYPVIPNQQISTITADFRNMTSTARSMTVGMVVFDGTVTNPSGQTDPSGVPLRSDVLAADMLYQNCGAMIWCPWTSPDFGSTKITPSTSTITVAFRLEDPFSTSSHYGEIDNVTVSGVSTVATLSVPTGNMAQLWDNSYLAPSLPTALRNDASAVDVAMDAAGDIYVTGKSYESGTNNDIVTIKYDQNGNQVGSKMVYDNNFNDSVPVKIALDGNGNVYVAGYTYTGSSNPTDPTFNNHDYVVVKYAPDPSTGVLGEVWAQTYDNTNSTHSDDEPTDMVVDSAGNVIVTGSSCIDQSCSYLTVQFTSSGAIGWHDLYGNLGDYDQAVGVSLDGADNAYVTGRTSGSSDDITTIKYDTAGNQAKIATYAGRTNDRPIGIRTDSAGNSYVVGWNFETSTPDIIALRYDSNLNQLWYKSYDSGAEDIPVAMTTDTSGNLYIVGTTGRVGEHSIVTLKYLPDGTNEWLRTFTTSGSDDVPVDIAVDGSNNVYILGSVAMSEGNTNFVTVKYSDTGVPLDAITYDKYGLADTPVALVLGVDSGGDTTAVAVGYSKNNDTGVNELTTVKYEVAYPDLSITSFTGPSTGTAGSPINLSDTVLNIDNLANKQHADSGEFKVDYYLAPDIGGVPDVSPTALRYLDSRTITNLSPGDSDSATTSVTIPLDTLEDNYFLVAIADPDSTTSDQNRSNNTAIISTPITIAGTDPDLVVTAFTSTATSAAPGDTISLSATVTNLYSIATGAFGVGIYLSTDTTIDPANDTEIYNYTVSSGLGAFGSDSRTFNVTIPTTLPSGNTYYVGIYADNQGTLPQGQVLEANENNNTEILRTGTSLSTRLVTDTDFTPGLPLSSDVVVIGTGSVGHVSLSSNVGWTTAGTSTWNTPSVRTGAAPVLADVNNDGKLDIMIGASDGSDTLYFNDGTNTAPHWTAAPTSANVAIPSDTYSVPAFANLDPGTDNYKDLVIGGRNHVYVYRNTGTAANPAWTRMTSWEPAGLPTNKFYTPTLADIDQDGFADLLLGQSDGTVIAFRNDSTDPTLPHWSPMTSWNGPTVVGGGLNGNVAPRLVDINGDGLVDIMIGDYNGAVHGYRNTGSVGLPTWTPDSAWDLADPNTSLPDSASPTFGDLNGDGTPDMIYGDRNGSTTPYMNLGSYVTTGTYISQPINAGTHGGYTILHYVTTLPAGTSITVDIRAGSTSTPDATHWTPWANSIPDDGDISSLNTYFGTNLQYVQYRVNLQTSVPTSTPSLYSIEAEKLDAPPQPTVQSVVTAAGGSSGSGGGGLGALDLVMLGLAGVMVRVLRRGRATRRH